MNAEIEYYLDLSMSPNVGQHVHPKSVIWMTLLGMHIGRRYESIADGVRRHVPEHQVRLALLQCPYCVWSL